MARNLDKEPAQDGGNTPENAGEQVPVAGPSKMIAEALGEHAGLLVLVQGEGEEEIVFAVRAIRDLRNMLILRDEQLTAQGEEIKALTRRLASQRGATTKARGRIVELEEAGKPRKLGPMAAVFDDAAEEFTVDDLMTAIDSAEEIVLAFSDGREELRGIKPRLVRAEAFVIKRGRLLFIEEPLQVTGPGDADTVTQLVGVALLLDGEQAAWCALPMPINIGSGQTINLAGSVIFG